MEEKKKTGRGTPFLAMRGIYKDFPGVRALDDVDFSVKLGEVMALVGENGAGKSTLMKILTGVYAKDAGEILIEGQDAQIVDAASALDLGISMIYQELNLIPTTNIAENIFLGREIKRRVFIDKKEMHRQAKEIIKMVGLELDTNLLIQDLSAVQRQLIEISKALSVNARLIIMDEPTSSLTENETELLLGIIKELKQKDVAIVYITHRMREIFEIADRVAVMRDGKMVKTLDARKTDTGEVVRHMVGRHIDTLFVKEEAPITDVVLEVEGVSTKDFLKDVSFKVRKGEILGFAGLVGAGRSEVMRAVFGIDKKESGTIRMHGKEITINNTVDALDNHIGFLPEDRKLQALILNMTVRENITLASLKALAKYNFLDKKRERAMSDEYIERMRVRTPSMEQRIKNLSGGNQQKVAISKWLATESQVLILDEPTRGIDVGSKKEIHSLMSELAKQGVAIIMISSELPEILGMSDRIVVMHEGRVKGELMRQEATQENIMQMAIS
ncbi:MAG: sugar ABC transporter ATP-binding protein [Sphaerochaetaceae bacterium]